MKKSMVACSMVLVLCGVGSYAQALQPIVHTGVALHTATQIYSFVDCLLQVEQVAADGTIIATCQNAPNVSQIDMSPLRQKASIAIPIQSAGEWDVHAVLTGTHPPGTTIILNAEACSLVEHRLGQRNDFYVLMCDSVEEVPQT